MQHFNFSPYREIRAATAYYFACAHADYFMGNSISTFSAMIIRDRHIHGLWASQYNRGNSELSLFVPGFRIPWVFVARGSDSAQYELMEVAVKSSVAAPNILVPFCIVHPSELHVRGIQLLQSLGVTLIVHELAWEHSFLDHVSTFQDKNASHLYDDPESLIGTYTRFDIPIMNELLQYEHFLYTDTDVFFRGPAKYLFLNLQFPLTISMGYEGSDMFPLNAGIYLASLPFLRDTYDELIDTVFKTTSFSLPGFGPGDQGVLNQLYADELKDNILHRSWNAAAYKKFLMQSSIVHFQGPKPRDYLNYVTSRECRFADMCKKGLHGGFCKYFTEWKQFLSVDQLKKYKKLVTVCDAFSFDLRFWR